MMKINIDSSDDLLAAVEEARIKQGLSERQLSLKAGMSHGSYWWWKTHAGTTSLNVALRYIKALNMKIEAKSP